ncbi:homeobox protein siamois-like [Hyla sarda]|uniref:homeobox protein siamois-like n=1 Tax=Hyla sarda TaxID=327740 RepID=UPI0024C43226|nr:homeobox protein siamois-like [Hyla sarda]
MDSELDQVVCTILSLEEDYPTLSPTLVDQETSLKAINVFHGLFSSMETQQDLQNSLTLKQSLLEVYNLLGIQQQAQMWKNMNLKNPLKTEKTPVSSSSTLDNVSNGGLRGTSKRKSHEQENEVCKKARGEKDETKTTATNTRCRKRTNYSKEQIHVLMREFDRNPYPDFTNRNRIGKITGISEPRIQVWFQNRRARHLLKPSKSEDDAQHWNFTTTEKICAGYNENPPNPQLYEDTTWMLPDMGPILY